jgi:hypothetical protein
MSAFKKDYSTILISRKYFGIWFEFWSEYPTMGDDKGEFFRTVREKYRNKWNGEEFRMRLFFSDDYFEVTKEYVKSI